jgi:hypothetical protein
MEQVNALLVKSIDSEQRLGLAKAVSVEGRTGETYESEDKAQSKNCGDGKL